MARLEGVSPSRVKGCGEGSRKAARRRAAPLRMRPYGIARLAARAASDPTAPTAMPESCLRPSAS